MTTKTLENAIAAMQFDNNELNDNSNEFSMDASEIAKSDTMRTSSSMKSTRDYKP